MRRSVQEAIRQVRATIAAGKKYGPPCRPGMAWEVAETLADEVERLHQRLTNEHRSASQRPAFCDAKVLEFVAHREAVSLRWLEDNPPANLSAEEARVSAQRLVDYGELHVDRDMKFRCSSELAHADAAIRAAGGDPVEVGKRGAELVRQFVKQRRYRAT